MAQDTDLHAYPALGVDVGGLGAPDAAMRDARGGHGERRKMLGGPERAPGPQDGDQLRDLARRRIPDEVAGAPFGGEPRGG
jgi:hypothetical protein